MAKLSVILLAAGDSTRLKSGLSKVMHPICGRPMIDYVLEAARSLKPGKIVLVVGHGREAVQAHLKGQKGLSFAYQRERLGTAHAAQIGFKALGVKKGPVLILNGDAPLMSAATLKRLDRLGMGQDLALLTAVVPNPFGYGRILRDFEGGLMGIVEEKNATPSQRQVNEINGGIYRAEAQFLHSALKKIKKDPIKKEFYLTDIVAEALTQGFSVKTLVTEESHEILGANTRAELAYLNQLVRSALLANFMEAGVGMQDPDSVYVDYGVKIGMDSQIGPGVQLLGKTRLGRGVNLEAGCILRDTQVGDGVRVKAYSYLEECSIKSKAVVGPFARVRPGSVVEEEAQVGNFVELKKTRLGKGSKANHLSYLGDAKIGKGVNVGAGTITCNYDGKKKFQTLIGDGVFIGSDSQLVAPVKIGKNAYIGAGSTITKNVPPEALALSRTEQKNIKGYRKKKK